MTIPFPHDPQLPQLQQLLDDTRMWEIIGNALEIEILSCTPKYVRYKPNTSCIVQYDLRIACGDAEPMTQSAHIKVYADHRAEAKATGSRAARLEKRLEDVQPDAQKVTFLSEVDGAFQIFPADLDLRSLARVADAKSASKEIKKALELPSSPTLSCDPEVIRYKPGRKALLRYQVDSVSTLPLYGKVFEDQSVVEMKATTDALISAGVPTARVLGIVEKQNFIVHETAPGIALNEIRDRADYLQWIKPFANTLWELQEVDLPTLPAHDLADEIKTLREVQVQLSTLLPHLAPRLDQLMSRIEEGLAKIEDILVTSHGDFYDDQAIVGDNGLMLIDLEAMRRSHPLLDAGNMLAHFTAAARDPEDNVVAAHRNFLNLTMDHTGATEQTVRMFESIGLLKLAPGPFRRLEEDWNLGVERLLSLAEATISAESSPKVSDPALPHLAEIMDRNRMDSAIAAALGRELPALERVDLIRHKPGRRAILRFQFDEATILYGKTFASKRGPKVFKITNKIAQDNAFGPDVLTPDAVAYLPAQKLVLLSEVAGDSIEEQLCVGDTDLAERIAFALFHLHSSNVDLGRCHDLEKELSPLEGRAADVGKYAPALASRAQEVLQRVSHFDHQHLCWRFRPIHRDMYHDQIMSTKDQLVVLDLDDAAMSEPTVDVANFATHLMLLGLQRERNAGAYKPVIDAFLRQYADLDHELDPALLDYLTAATALRLAGIHVSRENGVEIAEALLDIAIVYLEHAWEAAA